MSQKLIQMEDINLFLTKNMEYYRVFFILFIIFIIFGLFFSAVYDIFGFYLILEGLSFLLIIFFVINFDKKIYLSSAVRYFCLNAFASGCLLFSIAIFYNILGTTSLFYLNDTIDLFKSVPKSLFVFVIFFLTGCLFKLGCFPFSV